MQGLKKLEEIFHSEGKAVDELLSIAKVTKRHAKDVKIPFMVFGFTLLIFPDARFKLKYVSNGRLRKRL